MTPSFIRLRERFMDMTSPQSYSEWDEEQMGEELQAAAAFGSADTYAQRRLGYRLLLGRCGGGQPCECGGKPSTEHAHATNTSPFCDSHAAGPISSQHV